MVASISLGLSAGVQLDSSVLPQGLGLHPGDEWEGPGTKLETLHNMPGVCSTPYNHIPTPSYHYFCHYNPVATKDPVQELLAE